MKKFLLVLGWLTLLACLGEGVVLLRIRTDPWRLAALLESLALIVGVLVVLSYADIVEQLRQWAVGSAGVALGLPFLLLIPYLIFAFGTGTFTLRAGAKLAAYIAVPTLLLLPDRLRQTRRVGWRDFAAIVALGVPVSANWLRGIWTWPEDLYFFRSLFCVCVGAYDFMAVRGLEGIGYRLVFSKGDLAEGLMNFAGFGLLAIPLGWCLNFIHPHANQVSPGHFAFQFYGIYLTVAIPEELLFRGILQNFLVKNISHRRGGLIGLIVASVVFGAFHLHHPPVPNWRYGILATLAGIFYGNAYRRQQRLSASALTHTLVDTTWHFWF